MHMAVFQKPVFKSNIDNVAVDGQSQYRLTVIVHVCGRIDM